MPIYKCDICNIKTRIRTHYNRHLNTLKHKNNVKIAKTKATKKPKMTSNDFENDFDDFENDFRDFEMTSATKKKIIFTCKYCDTTFSRKNNLNQHIKKTCKKNYQKLYEIEKCKNEVKEKEIADLYKRIDKLIDKVGNTTNITNTNTINLNCYGNEDLSHITDKFKTNLLKIPYDMIPKMIEAIHFNQHKPENKNIYLPNKKEPFIKIYCDSKWMYKDRKETIKDLVHTNYYRLDDHFDDNGEELNSSQQKRFLSFQSKWKDEPNIEEEMEKKCELVIMNHK